MGGGGGGGVERYIAKQGYNASVIKEENDIKIKDIIFRHAPITRGEVASMLSLTLPTITGRVSEMLHEGILIEDETNAFSSKSLGRKPQFLRINPEYGYVVGIEAGPYMTGMSLLNSAGLVIDEIALPILPMDYFQMIATLKESVSTLLKNNHVKKEKVLGVGIGLPGFVDCDSGIVRSSKRENLNGKHLVEDLGKAIRLPVAIDNNVRVRAIREYCSGSSRPSTFYITLSLMVSLAH